MRRYSRRTEKAYWGWIVRFILFHGKRHPREMGASEITGFLSDLATRSNVSASTQNQALSSLLFLYRAVLGIELRGLDGVVRAKRRRRLSVVLTPGEVRAVLDRLDGVPKLMATILYGSGLRLLECARLRVKDMDLSKSRILVRMGKGGKDRVTMLPGVVRSELRRHLERIQCQHTADLDRDGGWVALPDALARKYPNAGREWCWQWVFPATRLYTDLETGQRRRYHLHETVLQRAVKEAVHRARIAKKASCHTLRHHADSRIMPTPSLVSEKRPPFLSFGRPSAVVKSA